jgi:hypothetical protein
MGMDRNGVSFPLWLLLFIGTGPTRQMKQCTPYKASIISYDFAVLLLTGSLYRRRSETRLAS